MDHSARISIISPVPSRAMRSSDPASVCFSRQTAATSPPCRRTRRPRSALVLAALDGEKVSAAPRLLLRAPDPAKTLKFAGDSPLEEDGFELVVPLSKRTAVPPFGFPVDGTGCERSNLRKRRFRVPGSQGNLARQGTCVVLNGWCIEACVGGVTGWAIGAGGGPRKPIRDCPADGGARESPRPSDVRSSQRGGSGRQRRSGMIGRDRQAARAVARSPRSTDRSEERGT